MNRHEYMAIRHAIQDLFPIGPQIVLERLESLALEEGMLGLVPDLVSALGGEDKARALLYRIATAMRGLTWTIGTGRASDSCVAMTIRDGGAKLRFDCAVALVQAGLGSMGDAPALINTIWNHTADLPMRSIVERGLSVLPRGYVGPARLASARRGTEERRALRYGTAA
jgi:hypothetical protein